MFFGSYWPLEYKLLATWRSIQLTAFNFPEEGSEESSVFKWMCFPQVRYVHCVAYLCTGIVLGNHQNFDPFILSYKFWLIFMGMKQNKFRWPTQKRLSFSIPPILNTFSRISPWANRINWCRGHWCGSTCMVIRLYNIKALKQPKIAFFCFSISTVTNTYLIWNILVSNKMNNTWDERSIII